MNAITVAPSVLRWAQRRSGKTDEAITKRFTKYQQWLSGDRQPTIKQIKDYASYTHVPLGYLLLLDPPEEELPVPDFRTLANQHIGDPSAGLLDVIYLVQRRQQWYSEHAQRNGYEPLGFVASANTSQAADEVAEKIRTALELPTHGRAPTWDKAYSRMTQRVEAIGCLVMTSGIVGSNTHRSLDPQEFRGFALIDRYAPTIFINGKDTRAAKIFTLAHELAHVWLGESGVDNPTPISRRGNDTETWCNRVASQLLVPAADLTEQYDPEAHEFTEELNRLAHVYKVSTLVILSRLWDTRRLNLTWEQYRQEWETEERRVKQILRDQKSGRGGGDFYTTLPVQVSKRFARALVADTTDGNTPYLQAVQLLGLKSMATFNELASALAGGDS